MGLTLPGVLGRVFAAAGNLFQSSTLSGEANPSLTVFGDGRVYISDGSEDLTSGTLVYTLPEMYVRARANRLGLVLRGENGGSIRNILELQDFFGAPIFGVGNAGGVYLNDNLKVAFGPNGPNNIFGDIYGHLQLGAQSAIRISSGPPGNMLTFPDATGELFQRARTSQQGSWTATNGTWSALDLGSGLAPTGFRYARQWTAVAAASIVTITGTGTSGYPVVPGTFYAAMVKTRSATVTRSKQLALVFYNAAGSPIGSAFPGTAVTDSTSAWTTVLAQGIAPATAVTCALQLTVTAAALGEVHQDTCAGLWSGLTSGQVTAWNPPYVYRMDAFGGVSATGANDGANVGDVFIRSDGPANVVQRFWTNAAAGKPWQQNWVADPRIASSPSRVNWYGGNYLQQGVATDPDYILPSVALGMLHNDPPDSVNRAVVTAVGSWGLLNDASNAQAFGGGAAFTQSVRKKSTGAPYVSKDGMFCFFYGLWDMANVTSGGGSGMMSQVNGYSASSGGTGSAVVNTLRDMICHARASAILPYTDSHFVLAGNTVSGTVQYAWSGGGPGQGGTFTYWSTTTGASFTFTVPADFNGGSVAISLLGAAGAFGGSVTWTGPLFSTGGITNPGPTSTSNVSPVGARARVCVRFKGLSAANAGQTIIGTITALDAGGLVELDCAYVEGQNPNLTAIFGAPRLPAAAGYVALGGAGSYWNGNAGATGNGDVTTLNTSLQSLVSEFDNACFYVDTDAACQQQAAFFGSDSATLGALGVHAMANQFVQGVQAQLPLVNFRSVNHDYRDTTIVPVGGPFTKQGLLAVTTGVSRFYADDYYYLTGVRASVNTPPQGASVIVDVLKNGSTIFTTTANRPSIAAGTNSASSAAPPDLLFLSPGDYLTVNVVQTGSAVPGADLTVNVLGRKIPIP